MKFSQWTRHSQRNKFTDFCQFKQLSESDLLIEMAQIRQGQAEFRKIPHVLNGTILYWLSQLPQSYWALGLSYFKNQGLKDIQDDMKRLDASGVPFVQPLKRKNPETEEEEEYLGGTGGTPEEQENYDKIRAYLKNTKPYNFITLAGKTFLIVNKLGIDWSPLASMYMMTDNSLNDELLNKSDTMTYQQKLDYLKAGHGLHGEYLSTLNPQLIIKQKKERKGKREKTSTDPKLDTSKQYWQWGGYKGPSQEATNKWLTHYFNNMHWHYVAPNANDTPEKAEIKRKEFEEAQKNLMPRISLRGGRPARRQRPIPIFSGEVLNARVTDINARRTEVVSKIMEESVRKQYQIEILPDGHSNIEIGVIQNHKTMFGFFKLDITQQNIITNLLQKEKSNDLAKEMENDAQLPAGTSPSNYIARRAGLIRKPEDAVKARTYGQGNNQMKLTPAQVIDEIRNDRSHDACVYPWWDSAKTKDGIKFTLHNNAGAAFVQAMPMHVPEKLIPLKSYVKHDYYSTLTTIAEDILANKRPKDKPNNEKAGAFYRFKELYTNPASIPEILPERRKDTSYDSNVIPTPIRSYASALRIAASEYSQKPKPQVYQELRDAGILESFLIDDDLWLEEDTPPAAKRPLMAGKKERQNESWEPLLEGMELALFARAFQYWLRYQRKIVPPDQPPELGVHELPNGGDDNTLKTLITEFAKRNKERADEVLRTSTTGDQFDDLLNKINRKKGKRYLSGWHQAQGETLTYLGKEEDWEDLQDICEEEWTTKILTDGYEEFMNGAKSFTHKDNRRAIVDNEIKVKNLAMAEFKYSKAGIRPVAAYIELRRELEKKGYEIDSETGNIGKNVNGKFESIPNPDSSNDSDVASYTEVKEGFDEALKATGVAFVAKILQFNLATGSRRDVEKGVKPQGGGGGGQITDKDQQRTREAKETAPDPNEAFTMSKELLNRVMPARSIEEREEEGEISGSSLKRRMRLANLRQKQREEQLLKVKKVTGMKFNSPEEYGDFQELVLTVTMGVDTATKQHIKNVVETAQRKKARELLSANLSKKDEETEIEEAGTSAASDFLAKAKEMRANIGLPDPEEFRKNCSTWNAIKKRNPKNTPNNEPSYATAQDTVGKIFWHIEKSYFNRDGFIESKEKTPGGFNEYLGLIEKMLAFRPQGTPEGEREENDFKGALDEYEELSEAFEILRNEDYLAQKRKEEQAQKTKPVASNPTEQAYPFRFTLQKLVFYCKSLVEKYKAGIGTQRDALLKEDLESLSVPGVLTKNREWLDAARHFVTTGWHQGQKVSDELAAKYKPSIQAALDKVAPQVAQPAA